jgi:hypothetical protein
MVWLGWLLLYAYRHRNIIRGGWSHYIDTIGPVDGNGAQNMCELNLIPEELESTHHWSGVSVDYPGTEEAMRNRNHSRSIETTTKYSSHSPRKTITISLHTYMFSFDGQLDLQVCHAHVVIHKNIWIS